MASISRTGELPASREEIWNVIAVPSRYPEWLDIHQGFAGEEPSGEMAEGDQFTQKVSIMGMPGEAKWTVAEVDAPNRLELKGSGPMGTKMRMSYELSGDNGVTSVTSEAEYEGAVLKPMAKALEDASGKAADKSLENLKALLA